MHYTTVTVGTIEGHEIQVESSEIEQAIAQGLKTLSEEINGPVELVNVIPMPMHQGLCLVVMARPYRPDAGILEAMKALGWGPETARAAVITPEQVNRMKGWL